MPGSQLALPFSPIRNQNLFSNHWIERRLPLEPEWQALDEQARRCLDELGELWRVQRDRVERYDNEQTLEEGFIQPVLRALKWPFLYQTYLRRGKPDYALFPDEAALTAALEAGKQSPDFWRHPQLVADAKAWTINLDRPAYVDSQREYPPEQIERYLNHSGLDYGILTTGCLWRLVPRQLTREQPRFETYFEVNLARLLDEWLKAKDHPHHFGHRDEVVEEFLPFYLFFSPIGFRTTDQGPALIDRAIRGSSEYRLGVSEGLRGRVFDALRLCIQGFLSHGPNGLDPAADLERCREQSFILLYRLLFVMYAEDRLLLPHPANDLYRRNRSLRRHREDVATQMDALEQGHGHGYADTSTSLYDSLTALFDLINSGDARYHVPPYNGGLFNHEKHPFLDKKRLPDPFLARVIDRLSRARDPQRPELGLFNVDYRDLAIQHLGSVYEGLLEMHPRVAGEPLVVVRKQTRSSVTEKHQPQGDAVAAGWEPTGERYAVGDVFLETDKGERRASGSYYTPNHIVDHLVEQTLSPLCSRIHENLTREITTTEAAHKSARGTRRSDLDRKLARLRDDFDNRVLKLHVLDPSMGSGHFLLRACQYLAEEIATHPNTGDPDAAEVSADESTLTFWKRRVVERCIYGVDFNPMAVELAKLALWLETVAVDQPLTFLDHHLRHGNSLVGARIDELGVLPGAPPLPRNAFASHVQGRLPIMLEPMEKIRLTPSQTPAQVKSKEKLYRELDRVREPFLAVADLWCSSFFAGGDAQLDATQYQEAVKLLDKPRKLEALLAGSDYAAALAAVRDPSVAAFHWELAFPSLFFDKTGRRDGAGFDAVIGNPPYDVLSEKELGRDLTALNAFLTHERIYEPSRRGKNNLYKLFICRAVDLLAEGGRLGFITPMALLGDKIACGIREMLFERGTFTGIDAFPQKDNVERRIFPEAKLSTCAFSYLRTSVDEARRKTFPSRVHPGRLLDGSSPSQLASVEGVKLYDPVNLTLASCSQEDWDLAMRIVTSGRMGRLRDHAEFFQGEVNETVQRSKGTLLADGECGQRVIRGAGICLYVTRPPSQGDELYLDVAAFLKGKARDTKAYHHLRRRVGLQESSAQNNFRRLVAALIPAHEFCNHKINYVTDDSATVPLEFIAGLVNSKLSDWYFRLGSTNNAVSHYQLYNLPCPVFADRMGDADRSMLERAQAARRVGDLGGCFEALRPGVDRPPFSLAVQQTLVSLVKRIEQIEKGRGRIARSAARRWRRKRSPIRT